MLLLCAGCFGGRKAAAPSPPPAAVVAAPRVLTVTLVGGEAVNDGNAVRVRLYQLLNDTAFRQVVPDALWQNDVEALKEARLEGQEILLYPGQTRTIELQALDRTAFVGVAAGFFRPDADGWRTVVPVSAIPDDGIRLLLDANKISPILQ